MINFNKTLTSEDMKKIVRDLETYSSDMRKQGTRLKNEIEDIRIYWTGYSADEFTIKCYEIYEKIAKEANAIENLVMKIRNVTRKLEEAEKAAANVFEGSSFTSGGSGFGRF